MNKKIFISDLHLGDGSKSDDFHRDNELNKLITKSVFKDNLDEIHILGDIYELWQSKLSKIIWAHPSVYRNLILYTNMIYGNHDFLPFSKIWHEIYVDDLIYAEHGHQHDIYNNTSMLNLKWPIGKYVTLVVGLLERLWHKDIDEYLIKKYGEFKCVAAQLQSATKPKVRDRFRDGKIVIEGHTHKGCLFKNERGIYANCGAWVDGVLPTYVEVEDRTVRLRNGLDYSIINEETL